MFNKIAGSSIDYDNYFKGFTSDSYLKSFSQQCRPNNSSQIETQIKNGFQNMLSQQNNNLYFSHPPNPQNSYPSDDPYHPFHHKNTSNPQIGYNVNAPSFVPSNQTQHNSFLHHSQSLPNHLEMQQNLPISSYDQKQFPSINQNKPSRFNHNQMQATNRVKMEKIINNSEDEITIQVWEDNLEEEIRNISRLSQRYCVIAYDCEFPGVIYQPKDFDYKDTTLSYSYLKANVDNLQIIQIGFTLSDFQGNLPLNSQNKTILSWQFNFKYDLKNQPHNLKSIKLLKNCGIDFDALFQAGIDHATFGSLLLNSGLVMNSNIKWITFHSMFDYGYLIKLLITQPLPKFESEFFSLFHSFFPTSFDIKFFFHNFTSIKVGGLESISKSFKLERKGIAHQAGSDSYLTLKLFFEILKTYRNRWIDQKFQQNINGSIFGLNFNKTTEVY